MTKVGIRILGVLGSNRGYWVVLWSTVGYCWYTVGYCGLLGVLLGVLQYPVPSTLLSVGVKGVQDVLQATLQYCSVPCNNLQYLPVPCVTP